MSGVAAGRTPRALGLLGQLGALAQDELLWLLVEAAALVAPTMPREVVEAERRHRALEAMRAVAIAASLPPGKAPTTEQFAQHAPQVAAGWNVTKVTRIFGRWSSATQAYEAPGSRLTDEQLRRLAGARAGGRRTQDEYLADVRRWLETDPPRTQTGDYDAWAKRHNTTLPAGERQAVSYSMLRKALPWSWATIKAVAAGRLDPELAERRRMRGPAVVRGPHDLVALSDLEARFQLGPPRRATSRGDADFRPRCTRTRTGPVCGSGGAQTSNASPAATSSWMRP
jgi:hypothetical protein